MANLEGPEKLDASRLGSSGSSRRVAWDDEQNIMEPTKHTEDVSEDRELYMRTTLRELMIYLVFLIVLCIITFGMSGTDMYYFSLAMRKLLLKGPEGRDFYAMTQMDDLWGYIEEPLMEGIYWENWYDQDIPDEDLGMVYFQNKLLGLPRIRQLKVRNDSCVVPEAFEREIKECFAAYSSLSEAKTPYGPQNESFVWINGETMDADSVTGEVGDYGPGGYRAILERRRNDSEYIIAELKKDRWVDRGTRAVIIDFTLYNANINLFCVVALIFEFPTTGGLIPSYRFRTVKLIRYVSTFDYFILACEGIFVAFLVYYIIEETIEIAKWRLSYFSEFWNILDILVILIGLACVAFTAYRQIMVTQKLEHLLDNSDTYANFEFLSYAQTMFNDATGLMSFCAWVKIFKYISFNKTMSQLSSTLQRCAKDVGGFAIMFFIFFFAYAQLGYLLFGTQVRDFSTFYDAVFTLLRTILGDFEFHELEQANRLLGPIFFITYVFFVFFVLLNMFLAIINDTYAEVKAELATQKNELELGDYFKQRYYNMLQKMNIRKQNVAEITELIDDDDNIDQDEWKAKLTKLGYKEDQIDALFDKFDTNKDGGLDDAEQEELKAELQGMAQNMEEANVKEEDQLEEELRRVLGHGRSGVPYDDFNVSTRRVDRIENSVITVTTKIEAALDKINALDRMNFIHRMRMQGIMRAMKNAKDDPATKRRKMEQAINAELDRFEQDASTED